MQSTFPWRVIPGIAGPVRLDTIPSGRRGESPARKGNVPVAGCKSAPVARRGKIDYSISLKNQQSANEGSVKANPSRIGVEPGGHNQKDLQP